MNTKMDEFVFERKQYDEDSSPESIEAIKARVCMISTDIIEYKEIPVPSPFSVKLTFEKLKLLAESRSQCAVLFNTTEVKVPEANTRKFIRENMIPILLEFDHVAILSGSNILVNTAVKFSFFQTKLESYSIHKSRESAILKIKEVLNAE